MNGQRWHSPIRFGVAEKVSLLFVVVILVVGFFLGAYFSQSLGDELGAALDERVAVLLNALTSELQSPILTGETSVVGHVVDRAIAQPDIEYCVVRDPKGGVIHEAGTRSTSPSREFEAAISVERPLDGTQKSLASGDERDAVDVIGTVSLQVSLVRLDQRIAEFRHMALMLVMAAVVLGSLASYLFMWLLLGRPMAQLEDATRRVARGELDVGVPIERGDEIGALVAAFNAMVDDLRNTVVSRDYVDKIVDSMINALIVVDRRGSIARLNLAAETLFGYAPEELVGKPIAMLFAAGAPSSKQTSFDDVLARGGYLGNIETLLRAKRGDIPVLFSCSAMTDADGKVQAAVCVALDIGDLKRAEEEVRKLSSAVAQSTSGIALADLEGRITYVNNAFADMHAYAPQDLLGKPLASLYLPEKLDRFDEAMAEVTANGAWVGEMESLTSDGATFPTYVSATTLHDEARFPIALILHVTDITTQKELELQLMQAQKLDSIGQLAGGVAHDFNNMLGAISGYADMIRQRYGGLDAGLEKYATRILEAAQRSADLTAKLLAFARRGTMDMAPVDIHTTIQDVFGILEHTIDRRITIAKQFAAPIATVLGDRTQLQNAVLNLAVNARDAMPEGGTMTFATSLVKADTVPWHGSRPARAAEQFVKITVADTGIGMDEQTLGRIFEPFFTTKQLGKGTGLGLASVYGTMQAHHGVIDVKSHLGAGSTFDLYLPLKLGVTAHSELGTPIEMPRGHGGVLVVDDEQLVREMACDLLSEIGYDVVSCADGIEAVEYYRQHSDSIDLVILDIVMPRLGGHDCFIALKAINPDIRVIVSSGYAAGDDAQRILAAGAAGFVQKPFDVKGLARMVHDAMPTRSEGPRTNGAQSVQQRTHG